MPQALAAPSHSPSGGRSPSPSSRNRSTPNATTATQAPAPIPTPHIHVASSSTPTPPLASPAAPASQTSSRAPSPRLQDAGRPSTSPSGSTSPRHHQLDDAAHLRAVNAGFERAMAGTSTVRARAKSDAGPSSNSSLKASIWERAGSTRRSGEVDDELERRWGAWERGEDMPSDRRANPKSAESIESGKRDGGSGGGGSCSGGVDTIRDEEEAARAPPQPAPGLLKRLRTRIVKDRDRVKARAERTNGPSMDQKYGPY